MMYTFLWVLSWGFGCGPQHKVLCSTTGSTTGLGLLHNMRNDYRSNRKVLHVVVEVELHDRVKALAAAAGCSITEFVTKVLEKGTCDDVNVGSGDSFWVRAAGGVHGPHSAGSGGSVAVGGVVGRGVDWDSILIKPVKESVVVASDEWLDSA